MPKLHWMSTDEEPSRSARIFLEASTQEIESRCFGANVASGQTREETTTTMSYRLGTERGLMSSIVWRALRP